MSLITTPNTLGDIISWLKEGYFVCLHAKHYFICFYHVETLDEIKDEKLIYIDVSKMIGLLDEGEWPWYIKNVGFVEYKSVTILPTKRENILNYSI